MEELTKVEEFAKEIVEDAAREGFSVEELRMAADLAKRIANSSMVECGVADRFEFDYHRPKTPLITAADYIRNGRL